jgi:hypothetical protein
MGILDNLGLSGLGNSLSNFRTNIDDQTGGLLTRLGQPDNQANLIAAASLLSGEGIPRSFALRNQVRSNLLANQQFKRQREGIEALKKRYANNPKILSLIDANPTAVMNAITAQAFTPVDNFKILTQAEKEQLGIKGDGVFQKNTRTGAISAVGSPKNVFNLGGNVDNQPFLKKLMEENAKFLTESSNLVGNINSLEDALETLETSPDITGVLPGLVQNVGGDAFLKLVLPQTANAKAQIESVVQESLKSILGAQFTEKEGERILQRVFDPAVSPQENAKRLRTVLNKLKSGFDTKRRYFESFTQGKIPDVNLPTLSDFQNFGGQSGNTSQNTSVISEADKTALRSKRPASISQEDFEIMLKNLPKEEVERAIELSK